MGKGKNGISEGRLQVLKGNYQKPNICSLSAQNKTASECSDMASGGSNCGSGPCQAGAIDCSLIFAGFWVVGCGN